MDRQKHLTLKAPSDRWEEAAKYFADRGLTDRELRALCLLSAHGQQVEFDGRTWSKCSISKRRAEKALKTFGAQLAGNTFLAGVRDLKARGLVVARCHSKRCVYYVDWKKVDGLRRVDHADEIEFAQVAQAFDSNGDRSRVVKGGQGARDTVKEIYNKSVSVYRGDDVIPCTGRGDEFLERAGAGDSSSDSASVSSANSADENSADDFDWRPTVRSGSAWREIRSLWEPWQRSGGVTDDELKSIVFHKRVDLLRRMFVVACELGWIDDSPDAWMRFLSIAHHAATHAGIASPMAVLVARVKDGLRSSRVRQVSDDWACRMVAGEVRSAE
jgi:hypothetical protein